MGIDPGPHSWRELEWMATGRRKQLWDHTALLCATIWQVNVLPKHRRKITADHFHPYSQSVRTGTPLTSAILRKRYEIWKAERAQQARRAERRRKKKGNAE